MESRQAGRQALDGWADDKYGAGVGGGVRKKRV